MGQSRDRGDRPRPPPSPGKITNSGLKDLNSTGRNEEFYEVEQLLFSHFILL